MWNAGWPWRQCSRIRLPLVLMWGTPSYFTFMRWHQCHSRLATVFLGTLWSSTNQMKTPYVFDWELGIALPAIQVSGASSYAEREGTWFFLSCGWNLGDILEFRLGWPFKARVCSVTSLILSSYEGHRPNLLEAWQSYKDSYRSEPGDPVTWGEWLREKIEWPIHISTLSEHNILIELF